MASAISFQGVTSGLQTDQLVAAIIQNEGQAVQRMKAKQTLNTQRSAALKTMASNMQSLGVSFAALEDAFNARSVSSSDSTNNYVTATATGAAAGSYDVKVSSVATRGKISSTMVDGSPTNLAVADPAAAIFTSDKASFAVQGTDGVIKAFELTNNSLNGLRDAINASGAGVTATIINTGKGANPYQLVVSAKETGTGTTSGVVTLAAIANEDSSPTTLNASLGITSGTLTGTFASPSGLTGGLASSGDNVAKDAVFSVNGIELTRKSNTVTDAVEGVTFTLKKGDGTNSTTLTVAQDKGAATTALQNVLNKYNSMLSAYKTASTSSKDTESDAGDVIQGPLAGDNTARMIMNQVQSILKGSASGLSDSEAYKFMGSIGVKTGSDGTLSLDATAFHKALDKDPAAVKKVFSFGSTSTSGAVSVASGGAKTTTGAVDFNITQYVSGGAVSGIFTVNGTPYTLSGTNGSLKGTAGTPLEGLNLSISGTGTGTLSLSRGVGQAFQDYVSSVTSYAGSLELARTNIEQENKNLTTRIDSAQVLLDKRETLLKMQFDAMESAISQMRTLGNSLASA